jgi:hypothetical protein
MPADHTVKITVGGVHPSNLDYSATGAIPRTLKASKGHTAEWTCDQPAAILFDPVSPCGRLYYFNRTDANGKVVSPELLDSNKNHPAKMDVGAGRYKYVVAVWDGQRVLIDDPDVIVEY